MTQDAAIATVEPVRRWRAMAVLMAAMFMALLDTTIVNVALPTIRTSLKASEADLSWIISGYALAFGIALIPAGRQGDRYGHKWIFFAGLALFTVASFSCGLAQTDLELVISRIIQGFAGGLFVPGVTALIQLMFGTQERGRAYAILGSVIGVSTALGPILGGLIIQGFGDASGWRAVFWVNLPIGVLALVAAALFLPGRSSSATTSSRMDWVGLGLLTAGLIALLVPLIQGQSDGWPLWTYLSLAGAVLLLIALTLWELRLERAGAVPLVPPRLFRRFAFTSGVVLSLMYFAAFTGIFFTLSLLWQSGLGHSALATGLVSVPFAAGSVVGATQSGRLASLLGRNVLIIGTGLVVVGLVWIWLELSFQPADSLTNWLLLAPLLIAGIGSGLFIAPNVQFITATVDPQDAGTASGIISVMQRLGAAIGIAIIGSVLFGTLTVKGPGAAALQTAFESSAASAMLVSVCLSVVAFALVFVLPRRASGGGAPVTG